jgi:hypothetical protein
MQICLILNLSLYYCGALQNTKHQTFIFEISTFKKCVNFTLIFLMQWFATRKLTQKHDEQKYILQTKHDKHRMKQMEEYF